MNTNEVILNQHGETTEVIAPADFGKGLSFFNPTEMPDLDAAEAGINIQPESIEFTTEGDSLRAVFNGFTTLQVKDKVNVGSYVDRRAAVLQTKTGIKINMGANLTKQLDLIPVGTAIQITYKGEQKTNSGNKVKTYDVHLLNVARVNVPAPVANKQPQLEKPAEKVEKKHVFKNSFLSTEFWTKANELGMTHEEGMSHLAEFANDFEESLARLEGNY